MAVAYETAKAAVSADIIGEIRAQPFDQRYALFAGLCARIDRGRAPSRFSVDLAAAADIVIEPIVIEGAGVGVLPILELAAAALLLFVLNGRLASSRGWSSRSCWSVPG